jgi:hypothetical protein
MIETAASRENWVASRDTVMKEAKIAVLITTSGADAQALELCRQAGGKVIIA